MIVAHSLGTNGPDIEFLILAFALLVLGVVLFLQKNAKPSVSLVLVLGAFVMAGGAFAVGGSGGTPKTPAPEDLSIRIISPADGDVVSASEPVPVDVEISGGKVVEGTSTDPTAGHFHVFVDGTLLDMVSTTEIDLELHPGEHEVTIEFTNADHISYDPRVTDTVTVEAR